jgi:hypothetical protein
MWKGKGTRTIKIILKKKMCILITVPKYKLLDTSGPCGNGGETNT